MRPSHPPLDPPMLSAFQGVFCGLCLVLHLSDTASFFPAWSLQIISVQRIYLKEFSRLLVIMSELCTTLHDLLILTVLRLALRIKHNFAFRLFIDN